jgi:K+-sensing histidine kinase KdpD
MSEAEKGVVDRHYFRYGIAAVVVIAALGLRKAMVLYLGIELPPFITFYPAVMFVAMLGGLWPGLLAAILSALLADYWIFPPVGHFRIERLSDKTAFLPCFASEILEIFVSSGL